MPAKPIRFPDIPSLNEAVAQLSVGEFDQLPTEGSIVICDRTERDRTDPDPSRNISLGLDPNWNFPIGLSIKPETDVTLSAIIEKMNSVLRNHEQNTMFHRMSNEQISDISGKLFALAVLSAHRKKQVLQCLKIVLESFKPAMLFQCAALLHKPPNNSLYQFGDFTYGPVDSELLRKLSRHAGSSDYFTNSENRFNGKVGLTRELEVKNLIDSADMFYRSRIDDGSEIQRNLIYRILDDYFHKFSQVMWSDFWNALDDEQARLAAAGGGFISSKAIGSVPGVVHQVSIFHREKQGHGWVAPGSPYLNVVDPTAGALEKVYENCKAGLRFNDWGEFELDFALRRFCGYIFKARDWEGQDLQSQDLEISFIHYVFALDSLIGGNSTDQLSACFAERTASIVKFVLDVEYREIQQFAKQCYDYRSAYSHRGEGIQANDQSNKVKELQEFKKRYDRFADFVKIVFACGCWCRRQKWCTSHEDWLNRLDALRGNLKAGTNTQELVSELGLDRIKGTPTNKPEHFLIDW